MPPTLVATANSPNANSFLTLAEGQTYWDTRLQTGMWEDSEDQTMALILATRMLVMMLAPRREFIPPSSGQDGYFMIYPTWTGLPATATQALPWGRIGMFDINGNAIPTTTIPQELKNATAELAGQMSKADRLIDSDTAVKGLTAVKAGSVALTFKDNVSTLKVLPDVVYNLLVPSWITDVRVEGMYTTQFDVIS